MLKNKLFVLAVITAMVLSGSAIVKIKPADKDSALEQVRVAEHLAGTTLYGTMLEAGESLLAPSTALKVQVSAQTAISTALAKFSGAKYVKVSLIYKGNTPFFAILLSNGLVAEVNAISGTFEDTEYAAVFPASRIMGEFGPGLYR
jgi:hypothetical protein